MSTSMVRVELNSASVRLVIRIRHGNVVNVAREPRERVLWEDKIL